MPVPRISAQSPNAVIARESPLGQGIGRLLAIGLAVYVLAPNIAWLLIADGQRVQHSVPYALMQGLFPSTIVVVGLLAALGKRLWIGYVLLLPFLPIVPIETAYILHYHEPSWYAIIATIAESNSHEIVEFLGAELWPLVMACCISFVLGVFAIVYLRRIRLAWSGRSRSIALTACVAAATICVVVVLMRPVENDAAAAPASDSKPQGFSTASILQSLVEPSFPVGVPVRYLHYYASWSRMRDAAKRLETVHFGTHLTHPAGARQIHVLVIGETGRADHWQMYGYERATNPELAQLKNLIRLPDIVTPQVTSRASVPIIVSRKKVADERDYFDERSISAAFTEAGFETYWLSNQMAVGQFESPIAVTAYDAKHVSFYSVADWTKPGTLDEALLEPLRQAVQSDTRNLFVVLHTMGSHANYAHRYPLQFDVFKPSLKGVAEPNYRDLALGERIRNSYDNSILYTDHFVAEVVRILAASDAIATMWYVSDHGEDFATSTCDFVEHGNGTAYEFQIPSVFWYSDAYAREFGAALEQFRAHSQMRVTTENLFESMIDMAALDFPGHDRSWSLFSAEWQPHQRVVQGYFRVDFDTAQLSNNCHMLIPSTPP